MENGSGTISDAPSPTPRIEASGAYLLHFMMQAFLFSKGSGVALQHLAPVCPNPLFPTTNLRQGYDSQAGSVTGSFNVFHAQSILLI
jgi:hypothetical protein